MTHSNTKKSANYLILIFIMLTLILSIGGNLLYHYQKKNITIEKHDELAAISKLKVEQIVNWRREQMDNARIIFNNEAIINHISEYNHGVNRTANFKTINIWINSLFKDYEFTMVSLVDPSGKYIINTNPSEPLTNAGKQYIEQAGLNKNIVFSDLFRYNEKNIYMDLVVPLYLNPAKKEGFSGVAFLRIDPNKYLYSKILKWPTQGHSSEVILIRLEGDSVSFLSDLQHQKNSALRVRKPMSNKYLLIVQALNGKKGILVGSDYRGVKVIGDVQTVPDSPWYVVTKIDEDEVFNPIVTLAAWLFIITFLLILIAAMIIYFIWKKQANEEFIINQHHLKELVDEQTIYLKDLNQQLEVDIAERKLVEEKLRESEQRLSFHFENSPLAVVEWNNDFIVTQWSKEAEHIFGWKATETLGNPIGSLNIIYEDDIPIVNQTMERLTAGIENVIISSNRNHTKSGDIIECIWYNTVLNDETGKMASVMSLVEDITERKKAENELRKLSLAVEQNPISIVITDINGVIEYGNPKVSNISGYTPEELIGKKPDIFKSGETPDDVYKELWTTILAGREWQGELLNRKKNGELYWEATSISPITDSSGIITHFLASKEDITQSKKDEAELIKAKEDLEIRVLERTTELAKSEERFRTTLDNLMEGCMFIGHDWTFLYVNDAAAKQLNKKKEELVGNTMIQVYPDRSLMPLLNKFQDSILQRKQNHFVEDLKFADGNVKWFDYQVEPVSEGVFIMSDDITVRILAEKEIIKLNEELENRVNERTSQLQIANKELEAFSYSVSHDLRAPLRSIDGWSMALVEDCADQLDKQGLEYLDRVREETQRMGHLIDDLLKLSRVSRVEIKKADVDLSTLAQDIKKRLLKSASERRIEFFIQPGMFTFGDPRMLDIALTNLFDNAFKFTGRQPVARIEFGQSMIDNKQTYWVRDNGVGFDISNSKNLFGAFQRMHRQSDFPGTGVGLATVQRIIHRHDGLIWAESKINEGATFYFTLT